MLASLILALHLWDITPLNDTLTLLYAAGAALIIADIFVVSFGILSFNGFIALYIAYSLGGASASIFGLSTGWPLFFGVAFVEMAAITLIAYLIIRERKRPITTGLESMIGERGEILEWSDQKGRIRVQGEDWSAQSDITIDPNETPHVIVQSVKRLTVHVIADTSTTINTNKGK